MNSIVFIETNKSGSSMDGIIAAKKLGYYVHLITSNRQLVNNGIREVDKIHFTTLLKEENIRQIIIEIIKYQSIDFIISFIDPYVSIAAKCNRNFCNVEISDDAFEIMEDKIKTRKFFESTTYSPYYLNLKSTDSFNTIENQINFDYPLILKAPISTGSRDVYMIHSREQMKNRIRFLREKKHHKELLIEEYLEGPQFIVEAIVYQNELTIVAIVEQEITKSLKFIVTGYSLSPDKEESFYKSITKITKRIVTDIGLKNGNCHLELRLVNGDWKIIELNPRMSGGAMNKLIYEAYGYNYAEQILRLYRGEKPILDPHYKKCIYAHYITVDTIGMLLNVDGIEEAYKSPGVIDLFIKPKEGQILSPPLSMGHRYGYVIACGKTSEVAKDNALNALNHISFQMSPI